MKFTLLTAAALSLLAPSLAHADEKSDAILKEARLRIQNMAAYSVTLQLEENQEKIPARIRFIMQRPDKYLLGLSERDEQEAIIIVNGSKVAVRQGESGLPMTVKSGRKEVESFLPMVTGNIERWVGAIKSTQYVTQKMLDETTVVDVIDITSVKEPTAKVRVYIDNNSQIRKLTMVGEDKTITVNYLNPTTDPLITEKTFSIE